MKIAVIDGQGGGIGKHIIEKLRKRMPNSLYLIALGTNALATAAMLKAGANDGASGENAICCTVQNVDLIVGSISILVANAFLGELTPLMATTIATVPAKKVLISINRNGVEIAGANNEPLPHQIDHLVDVIEKMWGDEQNV